METKDYLTNYYERYDEDGRLLSKHGMVEYITTMRYKVFHLYGTNVTIGLPDSADTSVQCSVCGTSNNINDDKCRDCGHSLVKRI